MAKEISYVVRHIADDHCQQPMKIEFDDDKNAKNIRERGISFELAADFDLKTARIWPDTRKDYGEDRYIALGYIADRLFSMAFTNRGDVIRIISLRKANPREVRNYEQHAQSRIPR